MSTENREETENITFDEEADTINPEQDENKSGQNEELKTENKQLFHELFGSDSESDDESDSKKAKSEDNNQDRSAPQKKEQFPLHNHDADHIVDDNDEDDENDNMNHRMNEITSQDKTRDITVEDMPDIPQYPAPSKHSRLHYARIPKSMLGIETRPFNRDVYRQEWDQLQNEDSSDINVRLRKRQLISDHVIRWRKKERSDNEPVNYDEMQTNTRLVKWNDGSMTLFIGNQTFDVSSADMSLDNIYLFAKGQGYICSHGKFTDKLKFTSSSSALSINQHLKHQISFSANENQKSRKVKLTIATEDPESAQALKDQTMREKELLSEKQRKELNRTTISTSKKLSIGDLEEEDDDDNDNDDNNNNNNGGGSGKDNAGMNDSQDNDRQNSRTRNSTVNLKKVKGSYKKKSKRKRNGSGSKRKKSFDDDDDDDDNDDFSDDKEYYNEEEEDEADYRESDSEENEYKFVDDDDDNDNRKHSSKKRRH